MRCKKHISRDSLSTTRARPYRWYGEAIVLVIIHFELDPDLSMRRYRLFVFVDHGTICVFWNVTGLRHGLSAGSKSQSESTSISANMHYAAYCRDFE